MMCDLLDIRCKIKFQVSIYDPFASNLGNDESVNQ